MRTGDAQTEQNILRWKQQADSLNASNLLNKTKFQQTKGKLLDEERLGRKSSLKKSMLELQNKLASPMYDDPRGIKKMQIAADLAKVSNEFNSEFSPDAEADYEKRKDIQALENRSPYGRKSWQ